ncbi:DNA repair protein [Dietzia alimentaria]|jgi:DNA repair protein RadC|uniref:JAB domain-containing protein n=1 Tax=Dietzia TaxID=37914 RepID=UPI000804D8FF|nr:MULTISPECIES: DNA repair protein RadC [unclassified Dietzia]MCY1657820.1 DNA repair protein RadC [Dietzia sp. SL131]OAV77703.1 DNA repair protein [Dietzia sp. 111N12-1]ODQ83806.1 DNA repair protein [Dietzia alimentaria]
MATPFRDLPAHDLPRERLVRFGPSALSDTELIAIHVGSGVAGQNAVALATRLVAEFGSLAGLARATAADLGRLPGIGPAKACRIVAAFALAGRVQGPAEGRILGSSADIATVAIPLIGSATREEVLVVVADGRNRVTRVESVARGGSTTTSLPIREVLAVALRHDGAALALAHNHPAGDPTPSAADRAATDRIRSAAEEVGLRFLDHVVVAGEAWRSVSASR